MQNGVLLTLGLYGLMSVLSVCFYGMDKRAARKGLRRVPENKLHWLALLGGWPGALFAQKLFRHKTVKRSFRFVFWLTVLINLSALICLIYFTH